MNAAVDDIDVQAKRNEPMSRHTSWRVGGVADLFYRPRSIEALRSILAALPASMPLTWLGLGSNLLVRDAGIRGAVICTSGLPRELERLGERGVRAGAGLACTSLARRCVRWQLGPAAFFAGIPGTVGGALAMNAGAFDGETWDRVSSVTSIDRSGAVRERPRSDYSIDYRSVQGPDDEWFLAARFEFQPDPNTRVAAIKEMVQRRSALQPLDKPSAGSVFRNPPGGFAGDLIERAGLKGARIGDAVVSEKHANFIVNLGAARAADIEALILHVQARVAEASGVALEPEVRVVGEVGPEDTRR